MHAATVVFSSLHYLAAMTLFGAAAYRLVLAGDPVCAAIDGQLRRVFLGATILALISALAIPLVATASMADDWSAAIDPDTMGGVMTGTRFGIVWSWRFIPIILAVTAAAATGPRRIWIAGAGLLVLASLGLVGHAAMDEGWFGAFRRTTQAVHLLAAGAWLGGLIPLALVVAATRSNPGRAVRALRRFSLYGIAAVVVVLATGVLNTVALVQRREGLLGTDYGHVLIVKLAMVVCLIGLALNNRLLLTPALETHPDRAARHLRLTVVIEIAVGALVIVTASLLGTLAPPIG